MSFLYNNVAPVTVALVASVMVWLFGGTRGDLLPSVVPWLFVLMVEVLYCFPQRHRGESTYEARARVWSALKKDPVVWLSVGLLALLLVPFVNNGLCPSCDARTIATGIDPRPPISFLPSCVSRLDHLNVVLWFAIALPALVLVRHAMTRRGKRMVLQLIVWNGAAVAALGFIQAAAGAPGPLWRGEFAPGGRPGSFFATFGYPNMAGDYFTTLFGLAVALWRDHYEQLREEFAARAAADDADGRVVRFWDQHYFLIPAALFFFAALNTLSRAAIILVTSMAVVCFVHTLVCFLHRMKKRSRRVTVGVWSLVVFGLLVFFARLFMPENIQKEVHSLETTGVLDRVTGKGEHHATVATALWREHLLFGCGGWGYAHLGPLKLKPEERRRAATIGGANVHNDHLQFLAEHGLVGFGALTAIALLLLSPVYFGWRQLVRECRFKKKDLPPKPVQIFVLPASVFIILMTILATFIHAFSDCPLRSPAVLTLYFVSMAALSGFMPKMSESHHHHHRS